MASFWYTHALHELLDGSIDFLNDTIKVLLVDNTTTADTEEDLDNLAAFTTLGELSGTGYTGGPGGSGRKTLSTPSTVEDETNDRGYFDADDVTWTSINAGTAEAAIVYQHNSGVDDSLNIPICYIDDGFPLTTNGGNISIQWAAGGICRLAAV